MESSLFEMFMMKEDPTEHGRPMCILEFGEQKNGDKIKYDKEALETILLHEEVKNRKIMVVSIVGAFRKGKSFILDYFLRYLYAYYTSVATLKEGPMRTKQDWIGSKNEPLKGFSWRGGNKRDTTGLVIWSDVFLHTTEDGEELAIMLIDTQGLFDRETDKIGTTAIASLSTLISSVQIYNLTQTIHSNDLDHLLFFTEYARIADTLTTQKDLKPFQNLQFLIRDWQNPDNFPYGSEGGAAYLKEYFSNPNKEQNPELKSLNEPLFSCYENIDCCLMPYPGKSVATSKDFDGRLSKIDEDFVDVMKELIPQVLGPKAIKPKKINGIEVTAAELYGFFKAYAELYKKPDALPEIVDVFESTRKMHFDLMMTHCLISYVEAITFELKKVEIDCVDVFAKLHEKHKNNTLVLFDGKPKMTNDRDVILEFKNTLKSQMESEYQKLILQVNKNYWKKKRFQAFWTLKGALFIGAFFFPALRIFKAFGL